MIILIAVILFLVTAFYFMMQNKYVQTYLTQKLANRFSEQMNTRIHIGAINVAFFNKVILEELWAEDFNHDTLAYINRMVARIDSFSVKRKFISFKEVSFDQSRLFISTDSTGAASYRFPDFETSAKSDSVPGWSFFCDNFHFDNADFYYKSAGMAPIWLTDINFDINHLNFRGDSLAFTLNKFSLKSAEDFSINRFSALVTILGPSVSLKNINIETQKSSVSEASLEFTLFDPLNTSLLPSANLTIGQSTINLSDLALFIPAIKGMDQEIEFSGNIYGNLSDLKGRDILFKTGENTLAMFDFYLNGLPDLNNLYLLLDLNHLRTTFSDLNNIRLPESLGVRHLTFPDAFYKAGLLVYKGNFTGFLTDFVAYGNLESQMGQISTDLSFVPGEDRRLHLDGKVSTSGFNIGELFREPALGNISFDGEIKGEYDKIREDIQGFFKGGITDLDLNGYKYQNIKIDGNFENKNFDGFASVNDPNLNLDFEGRIYLNSPIPEFDFDLNLRKADLYAIKLDTSDKLSKLAVDVKANFSGNNIDNLNGFINVENGTYLNSNSELSFGKIEIKTETVKSNQVLSINSDFVDARLIGKYNIRTLPYTFRYILSNYLPVLKNNADTETEFNNNFEFAADVKNVDRVLAVFKPGISVQAPFKVEGEIDGREKLFFLEGAIPGIALENLAFRNITFRTSTNNVYTAKVKAGLVQTSSGAKLYNASLNSEIKNNRIDTRVTWNNYHQLSYSGELYSSATLSGTSQDIKTEIEIKPSKIYVADSLWEIGEGFVRLDSNSVEIDHFSAFNRSQLLALNGKISEEKSDRMALTLENIDLGQIEYYLQQEPTLKGMLNGKIELEDFYGNQRLFSDLAANNLVLNGQEMGDAFLVSKWDQLNSVINTDFNVRKNGLDQLSAQGFYDPASGQFEFNSLCNKFPANILSQLIKEGISGFKGSASGKLKVYGTLDDIMMDGALMGENIGVTVDFTKVNYHLNDSVRFNKRTIIFDNITVYDSLNNQGKLNGTLSHQNYYNMVYNLKMSSSKILAMNTTPKDNGLFYGKVIADGNFYITGKGVNINLDGDGKTLSGTDVSISLEYEEEAEQYDFIRFVDKGFNKNEGIIFTNSADTALNLNLRIEVTPEAKAQFIYNSRIGDIIKAQGEGVLKFGMDKNGDMTLAGSCEITKGDYLFTLKNIINKKFEIEPGGTISWSGDPYNALIDLKAVYKLRASLNELFVDESQNIDKTQRIPVDCKILLTDDLLNPTISFDIAFPLAETRLVDQLQQFFNTNEEVERQVISLVVLGQFYTPEYMRGTFETTTTPSNFIGSAAGELFSNQVSNWLSQTARNIDIGFNYRPGTQITKDEVELALTKQLFNNRVTINGNIGNNVNPFGNNNNQIVGDFDLKLKLTDNGKIQLKAFNRSNNNIIYETAPYTQGIGLTFKEDFNTYGELIKKLFDTFKSKKDTVDADRK